MFKIFYFISFNFEDFQCTLNLIVEGREHACLTTNNANIISLIQNIQNSTRNTEMQIPQQINQISNPNQRLSSVNTCGSFISWWCGNRLKTWSVKCCGIPASMSFAKILFTCRSMKFMYMTPELGKFVRYFSLFITSSFAFRKVLNIMTSSCDIKKAYFSLLCIKIS